MSKRWYVVHTYSGYENRVKSDLEHRIETMGMQDRIFDIEIPMERVTEIKEGTPSALWSLAQKSGTLCDHAAGILGCGHPGLEIKKRPVCGEYRKERSEGWLHYSDA